MDRFFTDASSVACVVRYLGIVQWGDWEASRHASNSSAAPVGDRYVFWFVRGELDVEVFQAHVDEAQRAVDD